MPVNVVKSKADEKKWQAAKQAAAKSKGKAISDLKDEDYALVMHIYQNMKKNEEDGGLTIGNLKDFSLDSTSTPQSLSNNEVLTMPDEKKYTAKQAAEMVLKKAEELLKKSELTKAETKHDRCVRHVKESSPEVKNPHAACVKVGVKPEAWKTEGGNEEWGTAPMMKGTLKLAKWIGHKEAKRKAKKVL